MGPLMCDVTFICRSSDGFPLVESWDDSIANGYGGMKPNDIKMTIRTISRNLDLSNKKCSVLEGNLTYHYPKKMAFIYLLELSDAFKEEIKKHFGTSGVDYHSAIETMDRPYAFIKFGKFILNLDRIIYKIKQNFQDPNSVKALNKINESLTQVTDIMKNNINDIINRGETLQDIHCKNCIRDLTGCPFSWTIINNSCVSSKGDKISKLNNSSINEEQNCTISHYNKDLTLSNKDNKTMSIWPCNDGEAILSEMMQIEPKPWNGLGQSGPVNPHNGRIINFST